VTGEPAQPVNPLVQAQGIDLGVRTTAIEGLQTTLTLFQLELDSELLFVGDAGITETNRPSRRRGVEWASYYQINEQLEVDLEVTLTNAEFTDFDEAGDQVPGAIGRTVTAGFTWDPEPFVLSMRWREFGDIPLIEDGSVEWSSSSSVDARVGYTFELEGSSLQLALDVFNLLDSRDSDIEYFYASRLPGEPAEGIEDVHYHPLQERSARLTLSWRR
jgi:outer membrane receptor protein involved in Fe transport